MFIVRASAVICCLITSVALHAQVLTVNVIDRHTKEAITADSLRIEIPARSIDTVITTHRFGGWDPTVSVSEEVAKPLSYTWDGTSILGDGLRPFSHVQLVLCDVLGRTIEVMSSSASSEGRFRVTPREPMPALAFVRITDGTQVAAGRLVKQTLTGSRSLANGRTGEITAREMIYVTAFRQGYFAVPDSVAYDPRSEIDLTIALPDSLFADNVKKFTSRLLAQGQCGFDGHLAPYYQDEWILLDFVLERDDTCSVTSLSRRMADDDNAEICHRPSDPDWLSCWVYISELYHIDDVDVGRTTTNLRVVGYPEITFTPPNNVTLSFRASNSTGRYHYFQSGKEHDGSGSDFECRVDALTGDDRVEIQVVLY